VFAAAAEQVIILRVTMTTRSTDPLEEYEELVLDGRAPPAEEFAARHPEAPELLRRIKKLERLRHELDDLAAAPEPEPPPQVVGPYRLLGPLGAGGMGTVWVAEDTRRGGRCAVKLLRRVSAPARARFAREAELSMKLDHPEIARVLGWGADGDAPYLATELVAGESVRDWIEAAAGRRARKSAAALGRDVQSIVAFTRLLAAALAHAHAAGVIHRDVKPSNVMIQPDGRPKLIDFGIAVAAGDAARHVTRTGIFVGSHNYAAPEQLRGEKKKIGPWTDCYGLAATLYEMLTLAPAFACATIAARLVRAGDRPAQRPRALNPGVSARLDAAVMKALSPRPGGRFADARRFADALARV
jgi:serine/threonine protein kinase